MAIEIFPAVLGLLIATVAIFIPRVMAHRNDPYNDADSGAYLKETDRSARDIAQGHADQELQQENDVVSQQAASSDGRSPSNGTRSRETS